MIFFFFNFILTYLNMHNYFLLSKLMYFCVLISVEGGRKQAAFRNIHFFNLGKVKNSEV